MPAGDCPESIGRFERSRRHKTHNLMRRWIRELFVRKTEHVLIQSFRYLFVGGAAFAVDFLMLVFLTEVCRLHYIVSNSIAFLSGLTVNYLICIRWVFTTSGIGKRPLEFLAFAAIGLVGLGLNNLLLWGFTHFAGIYYMISKALAAIVVYLWNFLGRKYFIFK
jgi:putative flippase GtrA